MSGQWTIEQPGTDQRQSMSPWWRHRLPGRSWSGSSPAPARPPHRCPGFLRPRWKRPQAAGLARIWDGRESPYPGSRHRPRWAPLFLALPREANTAGPPPSCSPAASGHRPVGALPPARRRGAKQHYPKTATLPAGTVYGWPGRARSRRPRLRPAHLVPGLLHPTAALIGLGPLEAAGLLRRRRHRRRQVGRVGRRQGAVRAHALLREPRQRRGLRPVLIVTRPRSSRDWADGR